MLHFDLTLPRPSKEIVERDQVMTFRLEGLAEQHGIVALRGVIPVP
jgi:hypothetical protein